MNGYYLAAFFSYFFILLFVVVLSKKRQKNNKDFVVGNRSLNFWLTALSAHASDMSAWLFMGLPMAVFLYGISSVWIALGLLIGMWCNWLFISKKLREMTERYDVCTLSSFFEKRFHDTNGTLRLLTAAMLVFFLTYYLSASLTAMGLLIESLFGVNYYFGLTFATCVVVAYTFSGGYVTIAWTDLFQALFLLAVILSVPLLAINRFHLGTSSFVALEQLQPSYLSFTGGFPNRFLDPVLVILSWGLGYFGMPHILTKFMGIRDASEIKKSMYVGMTWQCLALFASIAVGLTGAAYFQGIEINPELVFVEQVKQLFPPFFAGFVLCGVIAANLSTMDSQLLVCASVVSEDFYKNFFGRGAPKTLLRVSRVGVLAIALIALLIAFSKSQTIMDTVFYAWTGLGSSIGPVVLMSLYSKRANRYGAITGILVGALVACTWTQINPLLFSLEIPPMIPGFTLGILTIAIVSYFFYPEDHISKLR